MLTFSTIEYRCLQSVIDGCGVQFNAQIDQELLDLIFTSLNHTNRFVRETGFQVCGSIVSCNSQVQGQYWYGMLSCFDTMAAVVSSLLILLN